MPRGPGPSPAAGSTDAKSEKIVRMKKLLELTKLKRKAETLGIDPDAVEAVIRKVRSTFVPPDGAGSVRIENIVSHCGRHRCSTDMTSFGVKREVGKQLAAESAAHAAHITVALYMMCTALRRSALSTQRK